MEKDIVERLRRWQGVIMDTNTGLEATLLDAADLIEGLLKKLKAIEYEADQLGDGAPDAPPLARDMLLISQMARVD